MYETFEKPERIDSKKVCYWAEKEGILLGNSKSKAKKLLEMGCVLETADKNLFIIRHIEGYNKTNHGVNMIKETCTCQANQKNGIECSHIKAVKLYKFMEKWNGRQT